MKSQEELENRGRMRKVDILNWSETDNWKKIRKETKKTVENFFHQLRWVVETSIEGTKKRWLKIVENSNIKGKERTQ